MSSPVVPIVLHPFYPVTILIPDYRPNSLSPIVLLLVFFGVLSAWLCAVVSYLCSKKTIALTRTDWRWVIWFALSGIIHITFEGYFALFHKSIASSNWIEAQMWRMYSLADSRYISNDVFTYVMEGCTALLWGPLCLLLAFRLIPNKSPYRHPIQMIVSLGQLYGLVLYYLIPIVDEWVGGASKAVSRPEWIYYWGEFIGLNAPWAIVPAYAIYTSTRATARAFQTASGDRSVATSHDPDTSKAGAEDESLPLLA